jgi:hypothetical protein
MQVDPQNIQSQETKEPVLITVDKDEIQKPGLGSKALGIAGGTGAFVATYDQFTNPVHDIIDYGGLMLASTPINGPLPAVITTGVLAIGMGVLAGKNLTQAKALSGDKNISAKKDEVIKPSHLMYDYGTREKAGGMVAGLATFATIAKPAIEYTTSIVNSFMSVSHDPLKVAITAGVAIGGSIAASLAVRNGAKKSIAFSRGNVYREVDAEYGKEEQTPVTEPLKKKNDMKYRVFQN